MSHYLAILEDDGNSAIGLWFPDLPGCFSAGETVDEALSNASGAVALYAEARSADGFDMPSPRSLAELRSDGEVAAELAAHIVAAISFERRLTRPAAE